MNDKYLTMAYHLAELSPDPSNQNGAIITRGFSVISRGYNHFYEGIPANVEDRDIKYENIVHAEEDACFTAAKSSLCIDETAVMYCPWAACPRCAKAIIGAGLKHLVLHRPRCEAFVKTRGDLTDTKCNSWNPSVETGLQWLEAAGVEITVVNRPVEQYTGKGIFINERLWSPNTLEFVDEKVPVT